ncbi:hypothetical protein PF006_g31458, partial [Phytophthora fragariae]
MNTVVTRSTSTKITAWVLDVAYKTNHAEKWNGGWVLYTHKSDNTWVAIQAGSINSGTKISQTAMAAQVIRQGIDCLAATTNMQQKFLRINTLDKTLRKRMDQGDRE